MKMNSFAHLQVLYILTCILSREKCKVSCVLQVLEKILQKGVDNPMIQV